MLLFRLYQCFPKAPSTHCLHVTTVVCSAVHWLALCLSFLHYSLDIICCKFGCITRTNNNTLINVLVYWTLHLCVYFGTFVSLGDKKKCFKKLYSFKMYVKGPKEDRAYRWAQQSNHKISHLMSLALDSPENKTSAPVCLMRSEWGSLPLGFVWLS